MHKNKKDTHTRMMKTLVILDVKALRLPLGASYASSDDENDMHGGISMTSSSSSASSNKKRKKDLSDGCEGDDEGGKERDLSAPGGTYPGELDKLGNVMLSDEEYTIRLEGQGVGPGTIQTVIDMKHALEERGGFVQWFVTPPMMRATPLVNYHASSSDSPKADVDAQLEEQQREEAERRRVIEETESWRAYSASPAVIVLCCVLRLLQFLS